MQHIRTQPAGPKAFRLYSMVRDAYRQKIGERAFSVYEALTYYVDPKTLQGTIPLKLLAATVQYPPTTVSRYLHYLWQEGLITITPQWDDFGCVPKANLYILHALPLRPMARQPRHMPMATPPERRHQAPHLTVLRCPGHSRSPKDMPA
jgi:DNA-binding IclR family transcriptional regulator